MKHHKTSEIEDQKKRKRRVHWSEDTQDPDASSSQSVFFYKKSKLPLNQNYDMLFQRMCSYIQAGDWDGLDQFLKIARVDEDVLNDLFLKKGDLIFALTTVDCFRTFVLKKISIEYVKQILNKDHCEKIAKFFRVQKLIVEHGKYDEEMKKYEMKTLIFFLQIDKESVSHFFEENKNAPYMTGAAKELYHEALAALDNEETKGLCCGFVA